MRFGIDHSRTLPANLPTGADGLKVVLSPSPVPEWTWQLWVDEGAELAVGRDAFDSLVDRFAALPGVVAVDHEDREVFHLLAPGIDRNRLEQQCRAVIEELAGDQA